MTQMVETLASYVPPTVARRFAARPAPLSAPEAGGFPAAALFADISGFTELTEMLARRGSAGAETLTHLLNDYFGQLIALINRHGGEVVKFAGDALLALWPASEDDLPSATARAAACALAIQSTLHDYQAAPDIRLSVHIGVGGGDVAAAHIGGTFGRWEYLVAGAPLVQIGRASAQAGPGEVILSPEAAQMVRAMCTGQAREDGSLRLEGVDDPLPPRPAMPVSMPGDAEYALRAYIPAAILSRLDAGQMSWLAELRRVTVLFINLPDLDYTTSLEQAQQIMHDLQAALYRYEGSINKLNVDDKGVTLVAALGLPPLAHEDDPARAVRAALVARSALDALGLRSAIGVATGQAFCGVVGGDLRREYTMIGDVVNLSARLMQAAAGDILCDEATYQAAHKRLDFESLPALMVKGKTIPVAAYRPQGESERKIARSEAALVGRVREVRTLTDELDALRRGGKRMGIPVIFIQGEPGIGKSRLVEELQHQAEQRLINTFAGWGDATEKSTPYHAWRGVFNRLLDLEHLLDPEQRALHVQNLLSLEPDLEGLSPLLNPVLELDLPDNDLTGQMSGQVRADNTRNLLVRLLQASVIRSPKVLIMEDAHWLDSASWALMLAVSQRVHPLLIVIATRPMIEPLPQEYTYLLKATGTRVLHLTDLSPDEAVTLACQRLGVKSLPAPVASVIREKAEGHPFYSEELAYALRDAGILVMENGSCRLADERADLRAFLPDTIQGVITSRIDRLGVRQQFTLKVASVIGRIFSFRILHDVHPLQGEKEHLPEHLDQLGKLDITLLESPAPDLQYIFKHVITQEVSYNLMTFDQRRQLHRAVAEWYELHHAEDLASYYPLLAHHWRGAEFEARAVSYLEQAGEQAVRGFANQEAIHFLEEALRLSVKFSPIVEQDRAAHWHRLLGEAYTGMGNMMAARIHLHRALALLGRPMPSSRGAMILSLLQQVLRQFAHRLLRPAVSPSDAARARLLETARAYELLGQTHFFANETLPTIYCILRALNLTERVGPSPELARAYASMCVVAGVIPAHTLARTYERLAHQTAARLTDQPAKARVAQVAAVYRAGIGDWDKAREGTRASYQIGARLGDLRMTGDSLSVQSMLDFYEGRYPDAVRAREELAEVFQKSGNLQHKVWYLSGQSQNLIKMGTADDADTIIAYEEEAAAILETNREGAVDISVYGILAVGYLRKGDHKRARQAADRALTRITESSPTLFSVGEGYAGPPEVYLTLWAEQGRSDELAQKAAQACKALNRFASRFPVGLPRALLWQGKYERLSGRPGKSVSLWSKARDHAAELEMPHEEGLALYFLGRHLPEGDPARREYLAQALNVFSRIGAEYDAERVKAAMEERKFISA